MDTLTFSEQNLNEWRQACISDAQKSFDQKSFDQKSFDQKSFELIKIFQDKILYGWNDGSYANDILSRVLNTNFNLWSSLTIKTDAPEEPAFPTSRRVTPAKFIAFIVLSTILAVGSINTDPGALGLPMAAIIFLALVIFRKDPDFKKKKDQWITLIKNYAYELDSRQKSDSQKYSKLTQTTSVSRLREYAKEIWNELSPLLREDNERRLSSYDEFKDLYENGDTKAIGHLATILLVSQPRPREFPREINLSYKGIERMLVAEYILPSPDIFQNIKQSKWVELKSGPKLKTTDVSTKQIRKIYNDTIYELQLAALHWLFRHEDFRHIQSVVLNGWIDYTHKGTGKKQRNCITSLQVNRGQFEGLDLTKVDPKDCFRHLKGIGSPELYDIVPIPPIMQVDKEDRRFIPSHDVADSLSEGINLASMDWKEFEQLVRQIFEQRFSKDGIEVKITQSSRDKGVDAIAIDPDPIRGGRIVIQAKRYSNTVDVSSVRDLYGTVLNEGATKGILVTTSGFGPDAYEFCKGKPLTLISGGEFLQILLEEGYKAHINLQEAKKLLRSAG